jgi:putative FmdB family regulatory protein
VPIYEYQCQKCGEVSEYIQKMSDDPMTTCEHCGGALDRLISRSAFHLKGGGWYKDLYSSSKSTGTDSAASSSASPTGSDASSSSATPAAAASTDAKPSKSSASGSSSGSASSS